MKSLLPILLLNFYLFATVGINFTVHYCGGEIESIQVYSLDDYCCCDSDEGFDDNCCKNDSSFYKINDWQQVALNFYSSLKCPVSTPINYNALSQNFIKNFKEFSPIKNIIIPPPKLLILLFNCTLTFYG